MIIPSIDIMNGSTVQLVGGRDMALDAGDPLPILESFRVVGETAVIDLDAALGRGSNSELIAGLVRQGRCRVGGGIRTAASAIEWLDRGASKVILGTAATTEILSQLPADRVIAALDANHGEVVVEGWVKATGESIFERMKRLNGLVGGYLVTFVEREGRLGGVDMALVAELVAAAGNAKVTVAGGVTTVEEVAEIDRLGADSQVGMALYTGRMGLGEAFAGVLTSDRPDGLWPTVVTDEFGVALGLTYSNSESLVLAIRRRQGIYHSRKRGLWVKGESSGATQELLRVDVDCDRDTLRFMVRQSGPGFCHEGTHTCWGQVGGIPELARTIAARVNDAPAGSYTRRLLDDPALLRSKLIEEAGELADSVDAEAADWETADVLYFALVALAARKGSLAGVEAELDRRALKVVRRPGNAKV